MVPVQRWPSPASTPVGPLSSGAAETFGGVATAYLLTSSAHVGSYEVVASAGGSNLGGYYFTENSTQIYARNGVFSTPVVTSQVTVTCTAGTPAVTAPNTGTGTISPPNTGDAGLAAGSTSNATPLRHLRRRQSSRLLDWLASATPAGK